LQLLQIFSSHPDDPRKHLPVPWMRNAPTIRVLVILLLETGMRSGREALALKWNDIDFTDSVIRIRESKTPAGVRSIPMSDRCRAELLRWRALLGPEFASARRMLKALADGETNPAALGALANQKLRATPEQLCDALGACTDLKPVYRRLLKMALEQLQFLEQQLGQLDQELATLLHPHQDAVKRLAEVPGLGVDSAQQIIAEVGPTAATFPSGGQLSSWVGACPGDEESAGVNYSHRSPKGNRHMRRILNQTANAGTRMKGSIFDIVYRRSVTRLGHNQAIGVIAHRQCRLIWLILHQGVRYEERGPAVTKQSKQARTWKMIRQLRRLGYRIEPPNPEQPTQAQG
jgi:transposase